jgi:hypothetical protein
MTNISTRIAVKGGKIMIILNKVYEFKAEFAKLLSIPAN